MIFLFLVGKCKWQCTEKWDRGSYQDASVFEWHAWAATGTERQSAVWKYRERKVKVSGTGGREVPPVCPAVQVSCCVPGKGSELGFVLCEWLGQTTVFVMQVWHMSFTEYYILLLCILIVRLTWLRFFHAFSSVVRRMPGYNSPSRGMARTVPKFLYCSQILCCSVYCLFCVVLCTVCV